ncbi:MAG: hypothetical protein D6824_09130, partial [Planctomycetota bacterium]
MAAALAATPACAAPGLAQDCDAPGLAQDWLATVVALAPAVAHLAHCCASGAFFALASAACTGGAVLAVFAFSGAAACAATATVRPLASARTPAEQAPVSEQIDTPDMYDHPATPTAATQA